MKHSTEKRFERLVEVEERVPGKQGLKLIALLCTIAFYLVEERVPGKQGLKQGGDECRTVFSLPSRRASSRKTRIETNADPGLYPPSTPEVEERVPGKQGLKLILASEARNVLPQVEERVP